MIRQIDYFNARIWGMRDSLLPEALHEELLAIRTRDAWIAILRDTPYSKFLGPSVDPRDSRILYRAVDAYIASRTHFLTQITPGNPSRALKVCLAEQDLQNLIAVTSGIYSIADPTDILSGTLAGGLLGADQLEALSQCRTLVEAADTLTTWGYVYHFVYRKSLWNLPDEKRPPLKRHLRPEGKAKSLESSVGIPPDRPLTDLRLDLNRNFIQILLDDARRCGYPVILRFMREKVDRINLMTTLMWRALPSDRDPGEFYLPGGSSVSEGTFRKMLEAQDLWQVVARLEPGPFKKSAEKATQNLGGLENVSFFETSLERKIIHRYSRPLDLDPLGAELLLSYLLRLRLEGIRLKQSLTRLLLDIPLEVFLERYAHV